MKKSYVFNTLICCGCTALIFLLHFVVYGGVLLKSPGYAGAVLRRLDRSMLPAIPATLEPEERPHTAVRVTSCCSCCTASFSAAFCSPPSRTRITF